MSHVIDSIATEEEAQAFASRLLEQLSGLEGIRRAKRQHSGMLYYSPNLMQLKAHQSKARTICYVGGNRAGKSTLGAMELSYHLTRKYPPWFPRERRFRYPIKAAISATEFPVIQRVIEPKVRQYLPNDFYRIERSNRYMSRIICKDGSLCDILTSEMKDEAYESADWDFVWCE